MLCFNTIDCRSQNIELQIKLAANKQNKITIDNNTLFKSIKNKFNKNYTQNCTQLCAIKNAYNRGTIIAIKRSI